MIIGKNKYIPDYNGKDYFHLLKELDLSLYLSDTIPEVTDPRKEVYILVFN